MSTGPGAGKADSMGAARAPAPWRAARAGCASRLATLALGMLLCLPYLPALAAEPAREAWLRAASEARILIENNLPQAQREVQRLRAALPADAPPADQARILNLMARLEIYQGKTTLAGEHAEAALALASRNGERIGQAEADLNLALNSVNAGKIDELITAANNGVAVLEGVNRPDLLSEAMLRMAMMYHRLGQLDQSTNMTMQTMEIARHSNDPLALTYAHQGLALSFSLNDRQAEARDNYIQMRLQARAAHSKMLEAYALNGLSVAMLHLGDKVAAEALIRQAIALFREVGAPFGVSHTLYTMGDMLRRAGRYAEAVPVFSEVVDTYERYDNVIGLWFALMARSDVHSALGNEAAAWSDAERAYQLAQKIGLPTYMVDSAQRMAALYAARGDHKRAYALAFEASQLNSSAKRTKASDRLVELIKRYEAESKQRAIVALELSNKQQREELNRRRFEQRWLWGTLVGVIVVLSVLALLLLRLRRSHATIQSLNAGLEQRVQARTAELRLQTRYLRTLIDTLPWRVWFKDTASRYLAVNQAAADHCGLGADQLVGKSDNEVRAPALAEAQRSDDLEVMQSRHAKIVEERADLDGAAGWIETFKAPVLDDDGSALGTVGFARDISERKAAEAARDLALAEAQRLAQVRSDFLAQMSHELRTPLNGILGYAQILRRDRALDQTQRRAVGVIQHSGEHLLNLINDILELAKIEAGKLTLSPSNVALPRFVNAIAEMIRVKADQKGLAFSCELAAGLPAAIEVDEKRLRQILLNLLSNAIKFTDRGHVRLAVMLSPAGKLRFEVHDTGVGIAPEQRDIIFQAFEQTGDIGRRRGGTGLGLAITRQFLQLMGGEIAVRAAEGGGSVFWFELDPRPASVPHDSPAIEQLVTGYEGARRRVLVADDMPENRMLAHDMLVPLGFEVVEAADGEQAVMQALALRPDLILMDIVMPRMDGFQATAQLRSLAGLDKVPVIAMSAGASEADRVRYVAAGMDGFLPKPVDYDALLALLASLLGLHWTVATPAPAPLAVPVAQAPAAIVLEPPSAAELAVLLRLAKIGNMNDIVQRARQIAALDERHAPFADSLSALAAGYQSKAVLRFVEAHLARQAEQTPGALGQDA